MSKVDFFVSYTQVDRQWAEWISDVLEANGYRVIFQAWDFRPGSNFVLEMQSALERAERVIAVLSPAYLAASFPQPEWAAALATDPEGVGRRLVPVMVENCQPAGLLAAVVQIRLIGLDAEAAARELLNGVEPGRAKPTTPVPFPGGKTPTGSPKVGPATGSAKAGRLPWARADSVSITWRDQLDGRIPNHSGLEAVEVHLVPVGDGGRLQVSELAALGRTLPDHGRQTQIFTSTEAVDSHADGKVALATAKASDRTSGLALTRNGQRTAWASLPRDMFAILDPDHLPGQVATLLRALASLDAPTTEFVVPAVGIEPAGMLSLGRVGEQRSTWQMGLTMPAHLRPAAEDALPAAFLGPRLDDIAAELAARIVAEYRTAKRL